MGGAVDFVGDFFGGVADVVGDVFDAVGDAGKWIDDNVLQPMLDDPVKTVLSIAAVATGNPQLVPYINAADAAAKGGDIMDIGKAYAVSYAAGKAGAYVGAEVAGQTGSETAGSIAKGAVKGATSAAFSGGDPVTGALTGGGTAAAGEAVSAVGDAFKSEGPNIEIRGGEIPYPIDRELQRQMLGTRITPSTPGEGFDPFAKSSPGLQVDTFPADAPTADYSLVASPPTVSPYSEQDQSYEIAPAKPTTGTGEIDYGVDSSIIELMPGPDQDYDWEGVGNYILKEGQNALGQTLINKLLGTSPTDVQRRRVAGTGANIPSAYTDMESGADPSVALPEVAVSKYELKTFSNDAGNTMNIPFKDDKPQIPIPPGYVEIKMNVGGLAKKRSKKATSVIQSAPSKTKTRKGLAART